jgi:hypothetical protein
MKIKFYAESMFSRTAVILSQSHCLEMSSYIILSVRLKIIAVYFRYLLFKKC